VDGAFLGGDVADGRRRVLRLAGHLREEYGDVVVGSVRQQRLDEGVGDVVERRGDSPG
jgi:hypothetical protein